MASKDMVNEWVAYARTDLETAQFLYDKMYPRPLAIICYHCQQSAEKMLKAALAAYDVEIKKMHDLGKLADELGEFVTIGDEFLDRCDNLTPYGVKVRYPQELYIDDHHAKKALSDAGETFAFLMTVIETVFAEQ